MRSRISVFIRVGLAVSFGSLFMVAQMNEQKARLYVFEDVAVKPFMVEEHEQAIREMAAISVVQGYPHVWYAYSTDDFHYYYIFPAEKLAEVDDIISAWSGIIQKKNYQSTYEYRKSGLFRYRPDLSLIPDKQETKLEDVPFLYWGFCYVRPGLEEPIEESWKAQAALFKRKGVSHSWEVYAGNIGTEMPFYVYLERASRAESFFTEVDRLYEEAGEEFIALVEKERSCYRKLEIKTGRFRRDLSYLPKEK
jgi:hypothetical protein